jgi:hypothetical protein
VENGKTPIEMGVANSTKTNYAMRKHKDTKNPQCRHTGGKHTTQENKLNQTLMKALRIQPNQFGFIQAVDNLASIDPVFPLIIKVTTE